MVATRRLPKAAHFAAVLLVAASAAAQAQTYPTRPVRIVVGYPPGGTVDFMARVVAGKLSEPLGQQVIVDNRPGGGTVIGTELVAKSPADGHTLLMANIAFGANPALHEKLPFDAVKDFTAVSLVALLPSFLVVHPSLPVHSVRELVALAKSRPGQLSYASAGVGSLLHLTMERFKRVAGIDIAHIPYKGAAPALSDVLGGQLAIMFIPGPPALAHIKAGRLRPLAVTSLQRMALLPEVPTIAESGFRGFELYDWEGLVAPAQTPAAIVTRLNTEVNRILNLPEVKQYVLSQGANAVGSTPSASARKSRCGRRWSSRATDVAVAIPGRDLDGDARLVFHTVRRGGVALIHLDVGYAVLAHARAAVERIYAAKRRSYGKATGLLGNEALHEALHVLGERERAMVRAITREHNLPLAVIAPYRVSHPLLKTLDPFVLGNAVKDGTLNILLNAGELRNRVADLALEHGCLCVGSSANVSGRGIRYRLQDVDAELRAIADVEIDYGECAYRHPQGLSSTQIDFTTFRVHRAGACYERIAAVLEQEFGVVLTPPAAAQKTA